MNQTIGCPVCAQPVTARLATGRKSGKTFVMLLCTADPKHLRAFISDKAFVAGVIAKAGIQESAVSKVNG